MPEQTQRSAYESLSLLQTRFVDAYIGKANGNATKAAKEAGYSEKTAYSQGQRLLKNVEIQAAVRERYRASTMGAEEVLARLAGAAKASLEDALEWVTYTHTEVVTGCLYDPETDTEEEVEVFHEYTTRRLMLTLEKMVETGLIHFVKSMKETRWGMAYELDDRQGAQDKIARALGLYKEEGQVAEVVIKVVRGVDVEAV